MFQCGLRRVKVHCCNVVYVGSMFQCSVRMAKVSMLFRKVYGLQVQAFDICYIAM